jgi:hypothetical protein
MEFKTRYITADEFKQYFGIDLQIELPNGDNESGKVAAYLTRIENRLEAWINANYFYNVTQFWETLNNNQKEQYKYALLEQAYYVLRMGDISVDSGYDKERGIIAGRSTINELSVAPNAMLHLENGGFLNTRIVKRGGYYQGGVANSQVVAGGVVGQKGEPGKDGLTPFIGNNGNWWIGGLDTGVTAAGLQGPQGEQGPQGIQGIQGEKGDNGSGFGNSYGNGVPWALPTANKTFTYFITAVENKYIDDDAYFDGGLMKDSYAPSSLCDANFGDKIIVSKGSGDDYKVWQVEKDGTVNEYTYTPAQQGDDQLALSSDYLKAVRIL